MPVSMTFTSLKSDLQAYVERGTVIDTTIYAQLPSIINLAERNIAQGLKIQGFLNVVTDAFVIGQSTYAKPDRWRETVSIHYGSGQSRSAIFPRAYEYCRAYWPDPSVNGVPLFYADYDYSHWLISPTPDVAYNFEVIYYEQPALLDDTNATNWLTDYAPQVLLYRALMELAILLKDEVRLAQYQPLYQEAFGSISAQDIQRIVDRTTTRQEA